VSPAQALAGERRRVAVLLPDRLLGLPLLAGLLLPLAVVPPAFQRSGATSH